MARKQGFGWAHRLARRQRLLALRHAARRRGRTPTGRSLGTGRPGGATWGAWYGRPVEVVQVRRLSESWASS